MAPLVPVPSVTSLSFITLLVPADMEHCGNSRHFWLGCAISMTLSTTTLIPRLSLPLPR